MTKHSLRRLNKDVQSTIAFDQPKLLAEMKGGGVVVEGTYIVVPTSEEFAGHGTIAEYEIRIEFSSSFPNAEPKVFETGKAIPHEKDFHVNDDGTCCVVIWELWESMAQDNSVQEYFDGPLKNFFLSQHHKKLTGKWPFDEERHGKDGLLDAIAERLGCARKERKIRYLLKILSKDWPRGHWECPCGSGRIIRKCCADELAELSRSVPKKNARRMLMRLKSYDH